VAQSREEAALHEHIMRTIVVPEVIVPIAANGGRQGLASQEQINTFIDGLPGGAGAPGSAAAPASPVQGGPPAPVAAKTAVTADPAKADNFTYEQLVAGYEALRDPKSGLIANKYPSVAEAIKGGVHLTHMAKNALAERDLLLEQVRTLEARVANPPVAAPTAAALKPAPTAAVSQTAVDQAQARYDKVLSDISESGGVLDAESSKLLSKASRELAEATANWKVEERFAARDDAGNADRAAWREVDSYMKEKHPAAERFSEEVAVFIDGDPLVKRAVQALLAQGDRVGATEHAWVSFERAHGAQVVAADHAKAEATEADLAAREQVRQEQLRIARKDAGVISGSAGGAGAHENRGATGASREEIESARERMRREGEAPGSPGAMLFRKMVIGPSLGFLNNQP
jgi:hypothetical protein